MCSVIDPVHEIDGYSVKRGDLFSLGIHNGTKVRQCLHVIRENLSTILGRHGGGVCTGAGLPSPQTAIVAGCARYFGLKCAVTTPRFPNGKRDFNRINASICASEGADVYGVRNPNPSGYERDVKCLSESLGYFHVKFGMSARLAIEPVSAQCENVPDRVRTIVVIAGSGLTACGIAHGLRRFNKRADRIIAVTLSGHFAKTMSRWHDTLPAEERFAGEIVAVASPFKYQQLVKGTPWDWTYESKAWMWMNEHIPPTPETLFWVVGKKCYDLSMVREIEWKTSPHEASLQAARSQKGFFGAMP